MKPKTHMAGYVRGWIGEKQTQYLIKYDCKEGKWVNSELVLETFKENVQPKGRTQRIKKTSELVISGKHQRTLLNPWQSWTASLY